MFDAALRQGVGKSTYGSGYYGRSEDTTTRKHPLHFHESVHCPMDTRPFPILSVIWPTVTSI